MSISEAITERRKQPEQSRNYVPEAAALRELAAFNDTEPSTIAVSLFGRGAVRHPTKISVEALVTLLRRCALAGEDDGAWQIANEITERVKGRLARALTLWRLDQPVSTAEEVVDEFLTALYETLFDLSPREQFWEIRFWVAFDRRVIRIMQAKRAELDRVANFNLDEDTAEHSAASSVSVPRLTETIDPLTNAMISDALTQLSQNERTAFLLKHVAGIPESSIKVDGAPTIATILQVSPRTVRNYLMRAENALAHWRNPEPSTNKIFSKQHLQA